MQKMKNHLILVTFLSSFFLLNTSFAFFCPTNFNQINLGDTPDQVRQQCGKPDKEETRDADSTGPQEWSYFIPQTVALNANQQGQGTLKTSITFDEGGKAINISVNGIGVGASNICGGSIQLGDTRDAIKAICGEPSFINKQANANLVSTDEKTKKITIFTYQSNPPQRLTFENGILTSKE